MGLTATLAPSKPQVGVGEPFDLVLTVTSDADIHGLGGIQLGYFLDDDFIQIGTGRKQLVMGEGVSFADNYIMDRKAVTNPAFEPYPEDACLIFAFGPMGSSIQMAAGVPQELLRVRCTALVEGTQPLEAVPGFTVWEGEPSERVLDMSKSFGGRPDTTRSNTQIPLDGWEGSPIDIVAETVYHPLDADHSGDYSLGDLQAKLGEALDTNIVTDPLAYMAIMQDAATIFSKKGEVT